MPVNQRNKTINSDRSYDESNYDNNSQIDRNSKLTNDEAINQSINLIPSDKEKSNLLLYFNEMRKESSFCDISFICQGIVIQAHRVVVSSWSRWLRSILIEGSYENIITLDIFNSNAFNSIIDYMYGVPLQFSIENADNILKVIRRLEMQGLEQQCWKYLISIIDSDNCSELHEIADRYDCPPLKLAAFRVLQESNPIYASSPMRRLPDDEDDDEVIATSGFTGPGEPSFYTTPSTFADKLDYDEEEEEEEEEDIEEDINKYKYNNEYTYSNKNNDNEENYDDNDEKSDDINDVSPKDLPTNAKANDVIKTWTNHLSKIYQHCNINDNNSNDNQSIDYSTTIQSPVNNKLNKNIQSIDWKNELKRFYIVIKKPEKITKINDILDKWKGREDQMISSLLVKYKKLIPNSLYDHLNELSNVLDNMTESSFIPYDRNDKQYNRRRR